MAHPTPSPNSAVILFDGVCNLCNGAVQFIIRRDPGGRFQFAALQSPEAAELLKRASPNSGPLPTLPDSIVLVERVGAARTSTQSTAILRIARGLRFPWPGFYALIVIPRPIRDWAYAFIAARRYRWFGKRDSCMVPTPELQARFLS